MQGLPFSVIAAVQAFSKDFLDDICSAMRSSELYTMAAKKEWERCTRFDLWPTGLPTRAGPYREQEEGEAASYLAVTAAAIKSPSSSDSSSDSNFAAAHVPQSITRQCPCTSLVSC